MKPAKGSIASRSFSKANSRRRPQARIAVVVIDTLQILSQNEPCRGKEEDEKESKKMNRIAREIGSIGRGFNAAMIVISQVNNQGGAMLYTSGDFKTWSVLHMLWTTPDHGGMWECPVCMPAHHYDLYFEMCCAVL